MKVIFLDFDGVLNNEDFSDPWPGQTQRLDGYTDRDRFGFLFDNACVARLQRLMEVTGAGVLVSSAWRYGGEAFIRQLWQERAMPGRLLGILPFDPEWESGWLAQRSRGRLVKQWLDENPAEGYVIIDDTDDFLPFQRDHAVLTDYYTGFNEADFERAMGILGSR